MTLKIRNTALNLKLSVVNPNVKAFANKTYVINSKLSKPKIIVIGLVLSILLSIFAVFTMTIIKSVVIEYKKSENS